MSTSKSLVLTFIWILLLSFIFILFVCILGAVVKKASAGSNWNEILTSGVYYVTNGSSATGAPNNAYGWGTLVVMASVSEGGIRGIVQMYFENHTTGGRVWQRNRWQNSDGFRPWVELTTNMPTFYKNYANLSSLASALGGLIPTAGKGDLNDYTNTSVSFLYNTQQLNKPADVTGGILITIVVDENVAIQILANYDSGIIYYRVKWSSVWKAWTKLSATVTT